MTNAIIYVRVSKARGDQQSLANQQRECEVYATAQGWNVVRVFIENGKSAYKRNVKRPEFDQAMAMIERNQATVFLVWKLNRFYRSGSEFAKAWSRIDSAGGQFYSVMEPWIDTSSAQGRSNLSGMAYQAEIESENRSQQSTSWDRNRAANGGTPGGKRPYGYEQESAKGTLLIDPTEADILNRAVKGLLNGGSIRGLIRELQPLTTLTRDGQTMIVPMTARGLRFALMSPTTYGMRKQHDGSLVRGWTGPVDPSHYGDVMAILNNPSRRTGSTNQVTHLLSGILTCGECGKGLGIRRWKANPTKRNPYVQESHRYTCQCGNSIDEANTDQVVMGRLWEIVTPAQWHSWQVTGNGWDQAIIDDIQRRFNDACEMRLLPPKTGLRMSPERLDEIIAELETELAIATGEEPLDLPGTDDPRRDWDSLNVIDQRKVINQAFQTVTLNASNGTRDPQKRIVTA